MRPGPVLTRQCPHCSGLLLELTLASSNTFGAVHWTDGWRQAPSQPDLPDLVKCPHCSGLLWLRRAVLIDDGTHAAGHPSEPRALVGLRPDESDYLRELETGLADSPDKVIYLRLRAFWAANDHRRRARVDLELSGTERENMEALLKLLRAKDASQRLMKAEIARELGRFDEARRWLAFRWRPWLRAPAAAIGELVDAGRPHLAVLEPPGWDGRLAGG